MTDNAFNFWQDHSLQYLEMAFRSDRRGIVDHPDGYWKQTGVCGDTVEIYLTTDSGYIQSVMYQTDGCMNTNACANTVARLIEGRRINDAWEITPEKISEYLETLPSDHLHCAELAAGALYRALADCKAMQQQPWKKFYRSGG